VPQTPSTREAKSPPVKKEYKLNKLWPHYAENFNEPKQFLPTFYVYTKFDMDRVSYPSRHLMRWRYWHML